MAWRKTLLNNIDELGKRDLSTTGYERKNNREGELFLSRDKSFASTYAVGKDGVKYYDEPLPVEEIPIGVIYKIKDQSELPVTIEKVKKRMFELDEERKK